MLITGAVRAPETVPTEAVTRAYNSIYVIDHDGSILSIYDKVHLVPFGEYLPFQDFLEAARPDAARQGARRLHSGRPPPRASPCRGRRSFLPLVCYEIIFPGEAVPRGERPAGCSTSPMTAGSDAAPVPTSTSSRRACAPSRKACRWCARPTPGFRRWSIRSGRVIRSLPLGTEGVLDAPLPRALRPTPYARWGDGPAGLMVAARLHPGAASATAPTGA